jgi:hypothetical protein
MSLCATGWCVGGHIVNWCACSCIFNPSQRLGNVGHQASEGGVNFEWWAFVEDIEIRQEVAQGDVVECRGEDFTEWHGGNSERTSDGNHFSWCIAQRSLVLQGMNVHINIKRLVGV